MSRWRKVSTAKHSIASTYQSAYRPANQPTHLPRWGPVGYEILLARAAQLHTSTCEQTTDNARFLHFSPVRPPPVPGVVQGCG